MSLYQRIEQDFTYHVPTPEAVESMVALRALFKELAHRIDDLVPDGREKSSALTHLEIVQYNCNAGIVRSQNNG